MLTDNQLVQAFELERNGAKFPIDFDDTWQEYGYNKKSDAKRVLVKYLIKDEDYLAVSAKLLANPLDVSRMCSQELASLTRTEIIYLSTTGISKFKEASFLIRQRKTKQQSKVYFILNKARNVVKIGFSIDPEDRLYQLEQGTIDDLEVIATFTGGRKEERLLHKQFAKYRIRREWFSYAQEIKDYIRLLNTNS